MAPDFRDMLAALTNENVEFLLVGAFAMAAHGCPRATGDIDFWIRASPENAPRVFRALARFGAPLGDIVPEYFEKLGAAFQIGLPPLRIDLITFISGVAFDDAWPNRIPSEMGGIPVNVIGREDLLANKKATGRAKDALDVTILERQIRKG